MNERLLLGSPIDSLLDRLYVQSVAQNDEMVAYFTARAAEGSLDWNQFDERTNEFLKDKLVASIAPRRSFAITCVAHSEPNGSSKRVHHLVCRHSFLPPPCATILAGERVREERSDAGVVIGTEYEPEKARRPRSFCRIRAGRIH